MKPIAWTFPFLLALVLLADQAWAQGFRGAAGGMRGSSGWAAGRSFVTPGQIATPGFVLPGASFGSRFGPGVSFRAPGAPFFPLIRRPPFVIYPGVFNGFAPVPFVSFDRFSSHHWSFSRHPGFVFIEVPQFAGTPFVSSYAPTILPNDRGYVEAPAGAPYERAPGQLAPFDPTPAEVVERMLTLAKVKKDDVLYDLGSGDGRIVIAAAKKFGVKAVGFEIDPGLLKLARENARQQGVEKLVEFREQDFMTVDLSPAAIVTLYLSYDGNLAVRSHLMQQLQPGARVVSYTFDMGDWSPRIAESYRDRGGDAHMIYLWEIGGPLALSDNQQ